MSQLFYFIMIGFGTGAIYAMCAGGLVVVYRASGVVNFAQGAFCLLGATMYYEFRVQAGLPSVLAVPLSVLLSAAGGALVHVLILRRMRASSAVVRVVATLGILVVIQSAFVLRYGTTVRSVPSFLPTRSIRLIWGAQIGLDRLVILLIGAGITMALWAFYRFTQFGRVTTAVAENYQVAAAQGHSPDRVAAINWAVGGALAGLAGTLIAPISFLNASSLILLVLPAIAAALFCGFKSYPLAFIASLAVGAVESVLQAYVHSPGWPTAAPFLAIVILLVARGQGVPLRSFILDRMPAVDDGLMSRTRVTAVIAVLGAVTLYWLPYQWQDALAVTASSAIICLSVVIVTGYGGQLSLAQYVLGGLGAFGAAKLMSVYHVPLVLGCLFAVLLAAAAGALIGGTALRARGISLGIATLGLGSAVYDIVLTGPSSGGDTGIPVSNVSLFGWDINPFTYPGRYSLVGLVVLLLAVYTVINIRRGVVGRHLIAVRSNERAAAALGIRVSQVKLFAFTVASGMAAAGACVLSFLSLSVVTSSFDVLSSVNFITATVVGGLGSVVGALTGSLLITGGVTSQLVQGLGIGNWLALFGGVSVLVVIVQNHDGVVALNRQQARLIAQRLPRWARLPGQLSRPDGSRRTGADRPQPTDESGPVADEHRELVPPRALSVTGLTVRFGNVTAVDNVALRLQPGHVTGLIGPNGAGKTTFIDAVSGFVKADSATVLLEDDDIGGWSIGRRVRAGVSRSFQSVDLFAGLTVRENLAAACERGGWRRYAKDIVAPGRARLTPAALAAVRRFGLGPDLDANVDVLPFGRRRLVALARAIAGGPSVLLLDEPASGLDSRETRELGEFIRALADEWGLAVLLVEHNVELVLSVCDEVSVLASGANLVHGTPAEIREDPRVLDAYLGAHGQSDAAGDVTTTIDGQG